MSAVAAQWQRWQEAMFSYDWRAWLFSFKTFLAAMCALYIGFASSLPRPYWAMATVYVVSHPMFGPTSSKGVYRIVGTLLGAAAAVVIVPNLIDAPALLCLAMVAWLSLCLFLSLMDRTPRSYLFMLAGYTAAFIGFPSVDTPAEAFNLAINRAQEIILGVVCAQLAATLIMPISARSMVTARIRAWMGDAASWCQHALSENPGSGRDRHRLAADITQFDQLTTFLGHDNPRYIDAQHWLQHLRARMLLLLPVLSAIGERWGALQQSSQAVEPPLRELLQQVGAWVTVEGLPEPATVVFLHAAIDRLRSRPQGDENGLLRSSLLLRLREFVDIWHDCRILQYGIATGERLAEPMAHPLNTPALTTRHRDYGMSLFAVATAAFAVLGYCALWIGTGWSSGGTGAMMAVVVACFYAAQDEPWTGIRSFMTWAVVALPVITIYLFVVLPRVNDFGMLVLVLLPSFVFFGLLISKPATMMIGMPLAVNSATLMALGDSYRVDYVTFANASLAMICGIGFVELMTRLVRPMGAEWSARRLFRHSWRTLSHAAAGRGQTSREAFAALMLDRLGLLAPRLVASKPSRDSGSVDMLSSIRAGLNILELRRVRRALGEAARIGVDDVLQQTSAYYRMLAEQHVMLPPPPDLLSRIDHALAGVAQEKDEQARAGAQMGLIGLKYCLMPRRAPM